jgi:hypothetical protein
VTVRHAAAGRLSASSAAATGWCSGLRRTRLGGRPRPLQACGGSGPVPGGQRLIEAWTPTT